jgi:2-oxo-hept-3-ene-1,7-dioate hydratase
MIVVITDELANEIAQRLSEAARTKVPTKQVSQLHPDLGIDDAYAIQRAGVRLAEADGRVVRARKIGLTSKVMQEAVGITEPDHGVIYDDMFYADGDTIPFDRFIAPRLEVELAFVLGSELRGPGCTLAAVLDATEYVTPAVEILDARFQMTDPDTGSTRTIVDTISDNAADAGIVIGDQRFGPSDLDLPWVCAVLRRNGVIEESGVAAAVLDHPATGVAWLADRLARHGVALRPGELVLAGSFTRPLWVHRGDEFVADYGPLGTIDFRFA